VLEQLSREYSVTVITTGSEAQRVELEHRLRDRGVRAFYVGPAGPRALQIARKVMRTATLRCDFLPPTHRALHSALRAILSRERFDAVVLSHLLMADLSLPVDTVIIADSHNVEFDVLRRMARAAGSLVRRAYATLQGAATERAEARCGRRVHSLLATSGRDQALFQRELGLPSVVIPNGIDLSEFQRVVASEGPPTILFAGLMSYHPNDDAIRWFLDAILPLVQQSRPDVHMVVAGAAPASWLRRRACKTLSVTGPVDDMRPHLRAATVVVAPIRHGGGTRVKVLEAMATGRPVVSTTIGCEGLGITHEDGVLIADDPRGFAEMVLRVLGDPALAARLSDAGHTHVTQCFDWDAIGIQLRAHVRQEIECFNTSGLTARAHL